MTLLRFWVAISAFHSLAAVWIVMVDGGRSREMATADLKKPFLAELDVPFLLTDARSCVNESVT